MDIPAYIALSRQTVLQRTLDTVANNLANMSTPGFKSEAPLFREFLSRTGDGTTASYVTERGTRRNASQGPLTQTGNPLDVALDGEGYLVVDTPQGPRYTRNGRLKLGPDGTLVTTSGFAIAGENGPIRFRPETTEITIDADGRVLTREEGEVGRIRIVRFENEQSLSPASGGLLVTEAEPLPAEGTKLRQGMIEESNVVAITELTRMMTLQRDYGMVAQLIEAENERRRSAIEKLGRPPA